MIKRLAAPLAGLLVTVSIALPALAGEEDCRKALAPVFTHLANTDAHINDEVAKKHLNCKVVMRDFVARWPSAGDSCSGLSVGAVSSEFRDKLVEMNGAGNPPSETTAVSSVVASHHETSIRSVEVKCAKQEKFLNPDPRDKSAAVADLFKARTVEYKTKADTENVPDARLKTLLKGDRGLAIQLGHSPREKFTASVIEVSGLRRYRLTKESDGVIVLGPDSISEEEYEQTLKKEGAPIDQLRRLMKAKPEKGCGDVLIEFRHGTDSFGGGFCMGGESKSLKETLANRIINLFTPMIATRPAE